MPMIVSHPDESIVLKRRFGQGAANIDKYLELDGYKATHLALEKGPEWIVAEIAVRLDLLELDVRNVLSYYSMLRTKPAGKYNVQVCTNISCMLRGGYEILDHCKAKLGIGHKGVTPDGQFSLEEVECIGACCWAPAMQVNYDFHEDLTPAKVDTILADYRAGRGTQPAPRDEK